MTVRTRQIRTDGLPEDIKGPMDPLVRAINEHQTDVRKALDGNLTLSNLRSFVGEASVQLRGGTPDAGLPVSFPNQLPGQANPQFVLLVGARVGGVQVTAWSVVAWSNQGGKIVVSDVRGLPASGTAVLQFWVMGA